jgi:hypothetical protein
LEVFNKKDRKYLIKYLRIIKKFYLCTPQTEGNNEKKGKVEGKKFFERLKQQN